MTNTDVAEQKAYQAPIVVLRQRLEARRNELKHALVDITPDAFIRALITSATINPDLQACTWQSLWNACIRACRDDLLPDGVEGAIVPYKEKATWIPMYQGLLRRFRRSGQFKSVMAELVRENEQFEYWVDENGPHLRHVPGDDFNAPITKVYALAQTKDGGIFITVMSLQEANKIRAMSRAQRDDSPWRQWPEEMYKKTGLRRLSKILPTGRDILPEEEPFDNESDISKLSIATATPSTRVTGTKETLDQFAGSSEPAESQEAGPSEEVRPGSNSRSLDTDISGSAPDLPSSPVTPAISAAWERGRTDREQGLKRSAVPAEYRTADRSAEALAWARGWTGEPRG
jgi:recombination protein RecT